MITRDEIKHCYVRYYLVLVLLVSYDTSRQLYCTWLLWPGPARPSPIQYGSIVLCPTYVIVEGNGCDTMMNGNKLPDDWIFFCPVLGLSMRPLLERENCFLFSRCKNERRVMREGWFGNYEIKILSTPDYDRWMIHNTCKQHTKSSFNPRRG